MNEKIDQAIWNKFIDIASTVITKIDSIFNKPFEEHYIISALNDESENSNMLRSGMIRSMIFRSIYQENQYEIDTIVKNILVTIDSVEKWAYFSQFFTQLCEASPKAALERLEYEVKNSTGLITLFKSSSNGIFARNYYTCILWAIEQLLLYKEYASRAIIWLFNIDNMNIEYKLSNSPRLILNHVFCAWFNISVLTTREKIMLAGRVIKKYENAWDLIFQQLNEGQIILSTTNKPNYRKFDDIPRPTTHDVINIYNKYINLCIENIDTNIDKWIKVINQFSIFSNEILDELLNKLKDVIAKINDTSKRIIKDELREQLYKHRYFSNTDWAMNENRLKKIEILHELIDFEDKVYDYLYLFNQSYDVHILHPICSKESNSRDKNSNLEENEIKEKLKEFKDNGLSVERLIILINKESHNKLGMYIAKYYTNEMFDINLYKKMIYIKGIKDVLCSYVSWIYNNTTNNLVIKKAKLLSENYENSTELYVDILKVENLVYENHPQIMDEDEFIKQLYWSKHIRCFSISNDRNTLSWVLAELKKYNNAVSYIECLCNGLNIFTATEILEYMINLKKFDNIKCIDPMSSHYLNNIMDNIEINFEGQYEKYDEIMALELFLMNIIDWDKMNCTQYQFKKKPKYYAELIKCIYLQDGEKRDNRTKEQIQISNNLFSFYYNKLFFCPCENNGELDLKELNKWVNEFKDELRKQNQLNLLESQLGRLFAYSPVDNDGYYPHSSVREIIEDIASDDLRNSYVIAEKNKRGVYSRSAGKTEKELAMKYKENADEIRILYPETAKIYDDLYNSYKYQSINERRQAEDKY